MAPKKTINLKLDNPTSTFQLKHEAAKGLSQPKLEQLYTDLFAKFTDKFKKTYKGKPDKLTSKTWEAFKDEYGILLAPDPSPTPLGDGKPLFKVRFLKDGKLSVATSIQQQKRSWYTQIQTEGTPGTPFSLGRTKNQFFEKDHLGRWFRQQIHHEAAGVMEIEPHLEPTLRKLLSTDKKTRTQGLNEYRAFSKYTHKNNIILGDKAENFAGLTQSRHINLDESAHAIKAGSDIPGTTYKVTKRSGASLLSPEARTNLSKFDRTTVGPNSVWARMGEYYGLSSEAGSKASDIARQYPIIPQSKSKPVDPKNIPKAQGRAFLKALTQEFIDQADIDPEIATAMAEDAYEGIRTGKGKLRSRFIEKGGQATFASMADLFKEGSATLNNFSKNISAFMSELFPPTEGGDIKVQGDGTAVLADEVVLPKKVNWNKLSELGNTTPAKQISKNIASSVSAPNVATNVAFNPNLTRQIGARIHKGEPIDWKGFGTELGKDMAWDTVFGGATAMLLKKAGPLGAYFLTKGIFDAADAYVEGATDKSITDRYMQYRTRNIRKQKTLTGEIPIFSPDNLEIKKAEPRIPHLPYLK